MEVVSEKQNALTQRGVRRPNRSVWRIAFAAIWVILFIMAVRVRATDAEDPMLEAQRRFLAQQDQARSNRWYSLQRAQSAANTIAFEESLKVKVQQSAQPPPAPDQEVPSEQHKGSLALQLGLAIALIFVGSRLAPVLVKTMGSKNTVRATSPLGWSHPPVVLAEHAAVSAFARTLQVGPGTNSPVPEVAKPSGQPSFDLTPQVPTLQVFLSSAPKLIQDLRQLLQKLDLNQNAVDCEAALNKIHGQLTRLRESSDIPEMRPFWQVALALECLVNQLVAKRGRISDSTLPTITGGIDLLSDLCRSGIKPDLGDQPPLRLLAVDDDPISRHALSFALTKGVNEPDIAGNAESALILAERQDYDVIFLDAQMPGLDGFELCTKIRALERHRATPVVFVTILRDFSARAKATLAAGFDLIPKPFLPFEITVKALTLAMRRRLADQNPWVQRPKQHAALDSAGIPTHSEMDTSFMAITNVDDPPGTAFFKRISAKVGKLRRLAQQINESTHAEARQKMLADLYLHLGALTNKPAFAAAAPASLLGTNLAGLVKKLLEDPRHANPSSLRTVSKAVDLMHELCARSINQQMASVPPIHLLVVDDDPVSVRTLGSALQMAFEKPDTAANGEEAITLANQKQYDVIFMDVQMPGMDGFTACLRIQETALNGKTPVVFVTSHTDMKTRTQAAVCGGLDFIPKPFLKHEVVVKALCFALNRRLHSTKPELAGQVA
jgi:CheY-like chemotaxis protein